MLCCVRLCGWLLPVGGARGVSAARPQAVCLSGQSYAKAVTFGPLCRLSVPPSGRGVFPGGHRSSPEGAQDCLRAGRGVLAGGMLAAVWWVSGHSGTGWGIAGRKRTSPATVLLVSRSGRGRACCRGSQPRVVGYVPWAFIRRRLRSGPRVRARCRSVRSASGPSCRSRGP